MLWFLLALAAVTSGRWWTAGLWSVVAFAGALQTVRVWDGHTDAADDADGPDTSSGTLARGVVAGLGAVAVTLAAAWGTGLAGVVLTALALTATAGLLAGGARRRATAPVVIGMVLPAIAAASVVLVVRSELWAGLFLVLAVSLYDAGAYLFGAESAGRWEGPVGGVIGVLAVTFTLSTIQVPPFDRVGAWITGMAVAAACVIGQWAVTSFLPDPGARAGALRRLDAYLLAGPTFVACIWLLGS